MNDNNILFYDLEVFKYNSMAVFMDINKEVQRIFVDDFTGLEDFVKGKTLGGFNNFSYDDRVITYMMDNKPQAQIKKLNDRIISGENPKIKTDKFTSIDMWQQADVSKPSLKRIEGNMGRKIYESKIPFDIDRPLTQEEIDETIEYCKFDVLNTVDIYKMRKKSYFEPKEYLISMLDENVQDKARNWNTTTIAGNILLDKPLSKWAWVKLPENLKPLVPEEALQMWYDFHAFNTNEKPKKKHTVNHFNCTIEFGMGGLHGTHNHIKKAENVKLLDVQSLYPNIIRNMDILYDEKILENGSDIYTQMIEDRVEAKKTDKTKADALKLILNSVYGNLKNKYSLLRNYPASTTICAYGQTILYELCRRLSNSCTLININTDGVAFIPENDEYKRIWEQWEKDFNLTLEEDEFDYWIQTDVNNYIARNGDEITVKGGDVNRYHDDSFFRNNDARILDIALVDKLIYNKDVLDTLMENLDKPYLYQYILQAGNTYKGTFDDDDNQYDKVNRVFAAKTGDFRLYKKRQDGGLVRFPELPDKMFLWNDDTDAIEDFASKIDLNHYYQTVNKRLERWL